ncbi:MAG: GNAT family N-acetyltransferase [Bacteroidota bacterium]
MDAILHLFCESIQKLCVADYDAEQIRVWVAGAQKEAVWQERIQKDHFLLAEREETLLGFGSLSEAGYLDLLYVGHHFVRQGIAHSLFEALATEAIRQGQSMLRADVSITARPFFEKMGFEVLHPNVFQLEGVEIMNFRMEKSLPPSLAC